MRVRRWSFLLPSPLFQGGIPPLRRSNRRFYASLCLWGKYRGPSTQIPLTWNSPTLAQLRLEPCLFSRKGQQIHHRTQSTPLCFVQCAESKKSTHFALDEYEKFAYNLATRCEKFTQLKAQTKMRCLSAIILCRNFIIAHSVNFCNPKSKQKE